MPINKVVYYGKTIIDLSNDSVSADKMLVGTIAHNKSGEVITGAIPIYNGAYIGEAIINSSIDKPIQNGNTLTIKQVYNVAQYGDTLEIDNPTLNVLSIYGVKQNNSILEVE